MKTAIMAALAASTVVGAVGLSAAPADARPWGYWHHRPYHHAYWRAYPRHWGYRYAYGPAYYYGPRPFWPGYYHRRFHRW